MDTDSPGNVRFLFIRIFPLRAYFINTQHAGYDADPVYKVTGFSQLHDDGTGGASPSTTRCTNLAHIANLLPPQAVPLSNFKIFPSPNCSSFEACDTSIFTRPVLRNILADGTPDDAASPGYFSSNLVLYLCVRVDLTAHLNIPYSRRVCVWN